MERKDYERKLKGAIIGRFAGCALGAPVELMPFDELERYLIQTNHQFPPSDYILEAPNPDGKRYMYGKGRDFTKNDMCYLSTDDDIAYTLLSLLLQESFPNGFSKKEVAQFWVKYLPIECTFTAERTTLQNLFDGIDIEQVGVVNNDEFEYIGAAIRIDGYAYTNPGDPEKAIQLAYQDASLSHRDSGLYSALYFCALISIAFTSNDLDIAMEEALDYIPKESYFYQELTWALSVKEEVTDYRIANQLVTERYPGMSWVHAINNACLTVWGIHLGKKSFEEGITMTMAMAYDNDCTSATVGSVLGAFYGIDQINPKWYQPWNNKILSYLNDIPEFKLDDVIQRFINLGIRNI